MSLQDIIKSNLRSSGTLKRYFYKYLNFFTQIEGIGQIKLAKNVNVWLHEYKYKHLITAMIARFAPAQGDIVSDGTTSNLLFIG